jgi:NhaP-type Na+/H+ or K+/H+ antiporter
MTDLAVLACVLAVVSLARTRLSMLPLTGPMLFVAAGIILGPDVLGVLELSLSDESVVLLAEVTLALLLFSDATRINLKCLRATVAIPARLLAIGLPLTIALGTVMTRLLLSDLSWTEAALVAAILTPTDAALGQAVVSNPIVPTRIRQALNVESGLNDGLVVPVIAVFVILVEGHEIDGPGRLISEAFGEIGLGALVGALVGLAIAAAIALTTRHSWTDHNGLLLAVFGAALGAYALSNAVGGNGFIAAFVCGLAFRQRSGEAAAERSELAEDVGEIGASATFVIFGALLAWPAVEAATPLVALCAFGTLTVGRMLPVWLSMLGLGLQRPTIGFLGWFGPRGLASMLFGLLLVSETGFEGADQLLSVIVLVVLASVVLHGITAAPWATAYGRWINAMADEEEMPEHEEVLSHPTRWQSTEMPE